MDMWSQLSVVLDVVLGLKAGLCQLRYQCGYPVSKQSEYVRSGFKGRDWKGVGEAVSAQGFFASALWKNPYQHSQNTIREDLNTLE